MDNCIPAHTNTCIHAYTYTDTYTIIEGLKAGFESWHIEGLKAVLYSLKVGFHIFTQKTGKIYPKLHKNTWKLHENCTKKQVKYSLNCTKKRL